MPKKRLISCEKSEMTEKKRQKYEKLQKKLLKLRNEILSDTDSSDTEQDGGGSNLVITEAVIHNPPTENTGCNIQLLQSDVEMDVREDFFTSNSPGNISTLQTNENVNTMLPEGNSEVLDLFGEDPFKNNQKGADMLPDLAKRFNNSLAKGFDKDILAKLVSKHPPAGNCSGLMPPILNPEITEAFKNKEKIREDKFIFSMQEVIAASIMALYKETEIALGTKRNMEFLADAINLALETFHKMSLHRRYLLSPFLNVKYKKMLEEQPIDKFLYGDNLLEKLKQTQASKSVALQVSSLMMPKTKKFGPTTQRRIGGVSSNYIPQPGSSSRPDTRHLNYNVPSNKPRMKISNRSNPPQSRLKNHSTYHSNQWRTNRRQ